MDIEYFIENWKTIDKKDINFSENEWEKISYYKYLSEEFIREFQDEVDWSRISIHQTLSEEFIREFQDEVDWEKISYYKYLSEEFIREFKDKVNWFNISYNQTLSETFIREFKDNLNWGYISKYQILSSRFIDEFIDYMYYRKSFNNIYKERFCQYANLNVYTINKRVSCCLGYQWNSDNKFIKLFNSTLPMIFSELL